MELVCLGSHKTPWDHPRRPRSLGLQPIYADAPQTEGWSLSIFWIARDFPRKMTAMTRSKPPRPDPSEPETPPTDAVVGPPRTFPTPTGPNDTVGWTQVLSAYKDGDPWAYELLFKEVTPRLLDLCGKMQLPVAEHWDALRDTMLKLWERREEFSGNLDRFQGRGWVFMENEVKYRLRTTGRRRKREASPTVLDTLPAPEIEADPVWQDPEFLTFLPDALKNLSDKQHRVVTLWMEGRNWASIARECTEKETEAGDKPITTDAVRMRFRYACNELRLSFLSRFERLRGAPAPATVEQFIAWVARLLPADPRWGDLYARKEAEREAERAADVAAELARRQEAMQRHYEAWRQGNSSGNGEDEGSP